MWNRSRQVNDSIFHVSVDNPETHFLRFLQNLPNRVQVVPSSNQFNYIPLVWLYLLLCSALPSPMLQFLVITYQNKQLPQILSHALHF